MVEATNSIAQGLDSNLLSWGFDGFFQKAFSGQKDPTLRAARVVVVERSRFLLMGLGAEVWATLSGRFRHQAEEADFPVVGDWVAVRQERDATTIISILPRRSFLQRKIAGRQSRPQGICANLQTVFLVSAAGQEFNPRRIERFLAAVWESGAAPIVVINKIDTISDPEALRRSLSSAAFGVPVVLVSAKTPDGLREIQPHLRPGETAALIGSSGVGKSSLLNALAGTDLQKTFEVREKDERGRHTTTRRELLTFPEGWLLIDTPGMREFGLWEANDGLHAVFSDLEGLTTSCRFADCRHQGEPGCALQEAAESGQIDGERLQNFHKLQRETAFQERRVDERAASKNKRHTKAIATSMRQRQKINKELGLKSW